MTTLPCAVPRVPCAVPRVRSRTPQHSGATIRRRRLLDLLDPSGDDNAVILVTAPAGSGKTTLLVDWVDARPADDDTVVAWLTIDESDNDLDVLRACVVAALAQCGDAAIADAVAALPTAGQPAYSDFSALLVDAIESVDRQICLVLDDAHLLHDPKVLSTLGIFLQWPPRNVRTILAGRFEPPLALQKSRLNGLVRDVSTADIAFTPEEASVMFGRSGISLAQSDLDKMMGRTEGWAAGLRLATMTLAGSSAPSDLIDNFTGSQHSVADYLVGEVLTGLPPGVRTFLVETSVPEWFTTDLADRLAGGGRAQETIDYLLAQNFLIDQVPGSQPTYRYHPLMRGYLRAEICRLGSEQIRNLERVAASWFADYRKPLQALQHGVHADDDVVVLDVLRESGLGLVLRGHASEVLAAIQNSPVLVRRDPHAQSINAAALLAIGNVAPAVSTLAALRRSPSAERLDLDAEVLRCALEVHASLHVGNIDAALQRLHAVDFGQSGFPELDAYALMIAGLAELHLGHMNEAQRRLEDAIANGRAGGLHATVLACLTTSAGISFLSNRLRETLVRTEQSLDYARAHGLTATETFAVARSLTHLVALVRMEKGATPPVDLWFTIGRSPDPAVADFGRRAASALKFPTTPGPQDRSATAGRGWLETDRPAIPAYEALLAPMIQRRYLASGENHWATELIGVTSRRLGQVGEVALLTAEIHRLHGRDDLAESELASVIDGDRRCVTVVTEIRALLAAAAIATARRHPTRAFDLLTRALAGAEPESILLPFAEGGARIRDILIRNRGRFGALDSFAERACAVIPTDRVTVDASMAGTLTRRELELLRELPSWRTAEQIAADHFVSVNTVKTHLRGIYRKLEVRSRRDAITAAHELGLL